MKIGNLSARLADWKLPARGWSALGGKIGLILLLALISGGIFWFVQIAQGVNRTWDGGGVDGTCGGAGTANNWSCAANWSGDVAPGASDVAIFDGTSTKNATINGNISVQGISINAGYTGTITQSGSFTVTVGSSHYSQAAGTFTGGSGTIDINGTFTLSGGTFTSTSGTMSVGRRSSGTETFFAVSGGTFNHNNGTVNLIEYSSDGCNTPYTNYVDVASSLTLYNVIVNSYQNDCGNPNKLSTASGDTVIAANDFTHTNGVLLGTWEVQRNVIIGADADGGTGTLTMTGTGSKTYTYAAGGGASHLQVNNAGISVSAASGTTALATSLFSLLSGSFTAPSGTMSVGRWGSGTETFFAVSGGTFNHNNGTIQFTQSSGGVCSGSYPLTVDVATSLTLNDIIIDAPANQCGYTSTIYAAAGDTIIALGNLTLTRGALYGTWEAQGNVVVASTADGGHATLSFTGPNTQIYTDQGGNEPDGDITINKTANSVTLASNADWNASNQDLTITAGTLLQTSTYAVATGAVTIGASGKWVNNGTGAVTLGGALANSGLVDFRSNNTCGGTDSIVLQSSSNGVQRAWSGAGTVVMRDIAVKDQGGSAAITAYSSTNTSGNGGNWTFNATCPFPIQPAAGISTGKMNLRSGKMNLQ